MAFTDQTAIFQANDLLTWQNMDAMGENDAYLNPLISPDASFGAYLSTNQSITNGAPAKLQFNTEEWDTSGYYDNATNYRFTPLTAGKYHFIARASLAVVPYQVIGKLFLYKNGSLAKTGQIQQMALVNETLGITLDVYAEANGTTDYFEIFIEHDHSAALNCEGGQHLTYVAAARVLTR